jgi:adenosylcobinamide-phosphate guanylyltransferase
MGVTALVMAGGKATRLHSNMEKPLHQIDGVPMIQMVLEATTKSKNVDRILVAVSSRNTQTAKKARELRTEIIETLGAGYEDDMKFAIKQLQLHDVLVVSADLPFLTAAMVDKAIETYRTRRKPALSVMCPLSVYQKMGIQPSYVFEVDGKQLVPIGLNIVDGTKIDEPVLEETVLTTESEELAVNVNTAQELKVANQIARQRNSRGEALHDE